MIQIQFQMMYKCQNSTLFRLRDLPIFLWDIHKASWPVSSTVLCLVQSSLAFMTDFSSARSQPKFNFVSAPKLQTVKTLRQPTGFSRSSFTSDFSSASWPVFSAVLCWVRSSLAQFFGVLLAKIQLCFSSETPNGQDSEAANWILSVF